MQKNNKTARDALNFLGIASSFAIKVKVREMDQSIRSATESFICIGLIQQMHLFIIRHLISS